MADSDFGGAMYWDPNTQKVEIYDAELGAWGSPFGTTNVSSGTPATPATLATQNTTPTYTSKQLATRERANTGKTNVRTTASSSADTFKADQRNSILDYLSELEMGQKTIDNKRIDAQIGKTRGTRGILDMVGRGIRSGGSMLANRNAGDSSAVGAIARAYGDLGSREQSNVNNQFEMTNRGIGLEQETYNRNKESGIRTIGTAKDNTVRDIVGTASKSLELLNEALIDASLPDRIAIEQEKESIRQQTLAQLQELDTLLTEGGNFNGREFMGTSEINPMGQDALMGEANKLDQAGTVRGNNFQYQTEAPMQFRGAQMSQLPLYSTTKSKKQD